MNTKRIPPHERFWPKVTLRSWGECWLWGAAKTDKGYGKFTLQQGQTVLSHRFAWESFYGQIPNGLNVLHRCDTPACCNPNHLFLGTVADNNRDMFLKRRHWAHSRTHCRQGHEYTPENTHFDVRKNCRICRICRRNSVKEFYQRNPGRQRAYDKKRKRVIHPS